jgi:hypothetical protein
MFAYSTAMRSQIQFGAASKRVMTRLPALLVLALLTPSCASINALFEPKAPTVLSPEGANVEFAQSTPSDKIAKLLGTIDVEGEAKEVSDAEQSARAELRNKAASMGASLVTIDNSIGQRAPFGDSIRVTLVGRAFRAAD